MSDTPETDSLLKVNIPELVDLCRKMERERDEWKEKAERLQRSKSDMLFTNCPDCKQFRGHGHQCNSDAPRCDRCRTCRECCGQGQVEIQSGPYMTQCPECNGTGKQTNQPNA